MLDIDVQVQMSGGIVAFNVVGLPDKAVAESRERVRASLHALGLGLPPGCCPGTKSPGMWPWANWRWTAP